MDEDDYVETSDVEELMAEQLDRTRQRSLDPTASYKTPPRKRVKLFHDFKPNTSTFPVDPARHSEVKSPIPATMSNMVEISQPTNHEDVDAMMSSPGFSDMPEDSQDPLLLRSPEPAIHKGYQNSPCPDRAEAMLPPLNDAVQTTTPLNTPPRNYYPSISPSLRLSSSLPPISPATTPTQPSPYPSSPKSEGISRTLSPLQLSFPQSPTDERAQSPSSLFSSPQDPMSPSPSSLPPSLSRSSPANNLPASSLSPPTASPLPSVAISHRLPEPDPPEIPPDPMGEQRYPLRPRNQFQMKPYTADKYLYEKQLKGIPDAIVNIKSIRRHHFAGERVGSDEDESQENNWVDDGGQDPDEERFWREQERRQQKVRAAAPEEDKQPEIEYPGILREDISSQEEDEVTRDARRLARAEKRKKKQEKEAQAKAAKKSRLHRPHKFPEPAPEVSGIPSDYFNQYDDDDNNNNSLTVEDEGTADDNHSDMHIDPPDIRHSPPPPPPQQQEVETEDVPNNNHDDDVMSIHSQSDAGDQGVEMDVAPEDTNVAGVKLKILKRMYPLTMISTILNAKNSINSKNAQQKSVEVEPSSDPLLPGQSRIRRANNPKDINEIKGDTESSDDEPPVKRDVIDLSDTDQEVGSSRSRSPRRRRLHKEKQPRIVHLVEDTSESDYVSEDDLETYMGPLYETTGPSARHPSPAFREPSLIDYMLNRPARIGSKRSSKGGTRHLSSGAKQDGSKFRLDVTTDGARRYGKERQTLLSFDSHGTMKGGYRPKEGASGSHKRSKAGGSSSRDPGPSGYHADEEERDANEVVTHQNMKLGWKERQKRRKAREKAAGVYCFAEAGGQVGSGRGRAAFITVDLEDDTFHQALVPRSIPTPVIHQRHPLAWPRLVNLDPEIRNTAAPRTADVRLKPAEDPQEPTPDPNARNQQRIPSDFDLPTIPAVKGFGTSSYTGCGYLHDLLSTLAGTQAAPTLISHTFQNFDLSSSMPLSDFCTLVPKIFDSYLEFAGDLPSPDTNDLCASWQKFGHIIHHYCTAFMSSGEPASYSELSECINPQLARVVEHFKSVTPASVDLPLLQLYWFSVELSLRLSAHNGLLPSVSSGTSKGLLSCLTTLLFQFGFRDIIEGLRKGSELEGSPTSYRVAEIWVWLIHVLDSRRVTVANTKSHPFWELIKTQIQAFIPAAGVQASENFWSVIFSLCFLSQLNEYGVATTQSRLPACWELVVAGLKKVRLDTVSSQDSPSRRQQDLYIALLISRCNHLRDRWHWKSASYDFLNVLSGIFKSRLYANLLHEADDYPKFFKSRNWENFSTYDPGDTAFAHFLKMIGHAIRDSVNPATGKPSLNLKKLMSMFLPVSSLSFTKSNPPGPRGMGMLYNRICGAAVAVHLDPNDHESKMTQARKYVSFADVDDDVRLGIVRGLMTWGTMMVNDKVGLRGITTWATEIADILTNELRNIKPEAETDSKEVKMRRRNLVVVTMTLVGALRQIAEACLSRSSYPEPGLLGCLKNLITTWLWRTDTPTNEFLRFNHTFFEARMAAIPPPERPPKPTPQRPAESESQDYGFDDLDLDWNAIDLPDALKGNVPVEETPPWMDKEGELLAVLKDSRMQYKWKVGSFISASLKREVPAHRFEEQADACDAWIKSFISMVAVEGDATKWIKSQEWLDASVKNVAQNVANKTWIGRIVLGYYYYVLRLEPKAYCIVELKPHFIANFLNALVSTYTDMESRYTALVLSIDGLQHPLFQNLDGLPHPNPSSGDYDFKDNFKELRLPVLKAVFRNTHRLLSEPSEDPSSILESAKCVDYCKEMLSILRTNQSKISTTPEYASEKQEYDLFCADVIDACLEFPAIQSRLPSFWSDWRRNLPSRS